MPNYIFGHITFSGDGAQCGAGPERAAIAAQDRTVYLAGDDEAERYMTAHGYEGYVSIETYSGQLMVAQTGEGER
jgi:hypothetical protein